MSSTNLVTRISTALDATVDRVGKAVSWIYAILIVVIILQVVLRYGFSNGLVVLEELQWHCYAIGLMFGLAYGSTHNAHIRVDILHMMFNPRVKNVIEILGILFLLMPFIYVVIYHSFDFVSESYRINEHSNAPSGLPFRWAIKAVIPVSFTLLLLSAIARLLRETSQLFSRA